VIDTDLLCALLRRIVVDAHGGARNLGAAAAGVPGVSLTAPYSPLPLPSSAGSGHGGRTALDAGLGAVLVFLPGWEEISRALDSMRADPLLGNASRVLALPLHSAIPTSEQRRAFRRPPPGVVKVVLATNIAETSLTIDDVVYVLDAGRVREKS
jgi:hypothetical protein